MKQRKSKAILVVSSAHLGVSRDVALCFAQAAKYYKSDVYHLGATITDKEATKYKKLASKLQDAEYHLRSAQSMLGTGETEAEDARLQRRVDRIETVIGTIKSEIAQIESTEGGNVAALTETFGPITMVTAPGMFTNSLQKQEDVTLIKNGVELSKYMFLSAIQPSGERATANPITTNAINYLKQHGKYSWVVAHPVPAVHTTAKEGLNNAHKFYTVGSLRNIQAPDHARDFYRIAHMPCAIMILMDTETGEYHSKQMFIDYTEGKRPRPMILDDGLAFFPEGVVELKSSDKGSAVFDMHAPYQHPGVLGALRCMNELHQPETFIDGGDNTDFSSVSHYTEYKPGLREGLRLADDLNSMERLLEAEANVKSIKHRILVDSNHHEWLSQFVEKNNNLIGMLDWHTLAQVRFKGWEIYIRDKGENKVCKFGDYTVRHGDKESIEQGHKNSPKGKYLCGHHHRYYARGRALSVGCGAGLGPRFIGNQITAWISQIVSLSKFEGVAAVNPKTVLHDQKRKVSRFAYRNKIFEVAYHAIGVLQ